MSGGEVGEGQEKRAGTGRSPHRDTGGQGSLEVHCGQLVKSQKIEVRLPRPEALPCLSPVWPWTGFPTF